MSEGTDEDWEGVTFPVTTAGQFDRRLRERLLELVEQVGPDEAPDRYGTGEVIEGLERQVAELLGKPSAIFAPSGTMLQQIALRMWADRTGRRTVGMHPTSHLEEHEFRAHEVLHGLRSVPLGSSDQPLTATTLDENAEPLGSLLIELPQRWLGYTLPTWEELEELVAVARARETVLHLDGARLWESAPFYAEQAGPVPDAYARIAAPFDSVYVSLYKIVGGIAGAVLAGPTDLIDEARVWRRRHGGELIQQWPMVVAARAGLERVLPRVTAYHERAVELAAVLRDIAGVEVVPDPPHTNAFRLYLHGGVDAWNAAQRDVARAEGIGLAKTVHPTIVPSVGAVEVVVSEASFAVSVERIAAIVSEMSARVAAAR